MAQVNNYIGHALVMTGVDGVNDNDVVLTSPDVSEFRKFTVCNTLGAADVYVSLDGTNYQATPIALCDLTATARQTYVVVTAAGKAYSFEGTFRKIKVLQAGATAVTATTVICTR